jgi:hypothetical protein
MLSAALLYYHLQSIRPILVAFISIFYLILVTMPSIPKDMRPRKDKGDKPVVGPRPIYCNIGNPTPSAVRCAQVSGYEPPLQENV